MFNTTYKVYKDFDEMRYISKKMNFAQQKIYYLYKNDFPFKIVEFINELEIIATIAEMPAYVFGAIRKENNKFKIYVNDLYPSTRLRFILAHELCHYFFHKEYLNSNNEIITFTKQAQCRPLFRKDIPEIEPKIREMDIEANKFAADLLMPEEKFIEIWNKETAPEQVSKFFGVSVEAAKIRASAVLGEIF